MTTTATVTMAADEDGTLLAAKVDFLEVAGAFPSPGGSAAVFTTMLFPGPYRIPAFARVGEDRAHEHVGPRRVPRPVDDRDGRARADDRLPRRGSGIDPLELRRRNVIRDDELPYTMPTGMVYDQMTAAATLEQAAEKIGYDELREQQREWRARGPACRHRHEPASSSRPRWRSAG